MTPLNLVLSDKWFEKIKSGEKTHEYREFKPYWIKRILMADNVTDISQIKDGFMRDVTRVRFQKAYRKNAEIMEFHVRSIQVLTHGKDTDLKTEKPVFDIELGARRL